MFAVKLLFKFKVLTFTLGNQLREKLSFHIFNVNRRDTFGQAHSR